MRSHNFGSVFVAFLALFAASLVAVAQPAPPVDVKFYGSATVGVGGTTTLGLTINNPNAATNFTAVSGSDTLPGDQVISTPNGLLSACTPGPHLGRSRPSPAQTPLPSGRPRFLLTELARSKLMSRA